MSLNREKYDLALHSLYECANNCDVAYVGSKNSKCNREYYMLDKLINEHFDNPPLKFEELKPNMWVWDKKYEMWNCILAKRINCAGEQEIEFKYFLEREEELYNDIFENDRFYEKQVKNDVEL